MITPAQHNAIASAAVAYGKARAAQFIDRELLPDEQLALDRAADKAWSDFLAALASVTNWSANEGAEP